jgi:hypothetical protein
MSPLLGQGDPGVIADSAESARLPRAPLAGLLLDLHRPGKPLRPHALAGGYDAGRQGQQAYRGQEVRRQRAAM